MDKIKTFLISVLTAGVMFVLILLVIDALFGNVKSILGYCVQGLIFGVCMGVYDTWFRKGKKK